MRSDCGGGEPYKTSPTDRGPNPRRSGSTSFEGLPSSNFFRLGWGWVNTSKSSLMLRQR